MNTNGMEIERKYLIAMPEETVLARAESRSEITQIYLAGEKGCSERVRCRKYPERTVYTHTVKKHVTAVTRIEDEHEISEQDYRTLCLRADPERCVIEKTRYVLPYLGQEFELDVYPFWTRQAVLELELTSEEQPIEFPPELRILRELTEDKRYTNASLAREIPAEEI